MKQKMKRSFLNQRNKPASHHSKSLSQTRSTVAFRTIFKNRNNHQTNYITQEQSNINQSRAKYSQTRTQLANSRHTSRSVAGKSSYFLDLKEGQESRVSKNLSCRSVASSRSKYSEKSKSKLMSCTRVAKFRKIEDLEKKVENILEQKLCLQKNKIRNKIIRSSDCQQIEKQYQVIVEEMRKFKSEVEDEEDEEVIQEIGKKIQILEKMLAENYAQSQLFKESYYKYKNVRKSLNDNVSKGTYTKHNDFLRKMPSSTPIRPTPSIYNNSTNQQTYVKPDRKAYEKDDLSKNKYSVNRQPVPRSSYMKDYLSYGSLPKYPKKAEEKLPEEKLTLPIKQTWYEAEFKQKKANLLNPKQLDCTANKIKQEIMRCRRLKISFIPQKVNELKRSFRQQVQLQKKQPKLEKENFGNCSFLKSSMLKSEFGRQFKNSNLKIENPIKDKRLNNFKYQYKANLHA